MKARTPSSGAKRAGSGGWLAHLDDLGSHLVGCHLMSARPQPPGPCHLNRVQAGSSNLRPLTQVMPAASPSTTGHRRWWWSVLGEPCSGGGMCAWSRPPVRSQVDGDAGGNVEFTPPVRDGCAPGRAAVVVCRVEQWQEHGGYRFV